MVGYPVSYGDSNDHKICLSQSVPSRERTLKVVSVALFLGSIIVTPALAVEPATAVASNTKEVSQASFALTCAVCAAAGSVCKSAVEKATSKNPKLLVPFGCVALMSWCAAKASPL
jgi:hypothetical protein